MLMFSISNQFQKTANFIKNDIWRIRRTKLPPGKSFFLTLLRVLVLSVRGFDEDKCQLRASALTFYSLISIVPVAAMAFGFAKGFGIDKYLEQELRSKFAGQEPILDKVIVFSRSLLESTRGELIAGVGLLLLFWAVVRMLGQIEDSLNEIWGVKEQRSFGRMFSDYVSFVLICPVILIVSSSLTIFITTQVTVILEKIAILGALSPLVLFLLRLLPYTLIWGLFTFVYIFMPNTRVRLSSALLAGIIAGTIYEAVQWAYINSQVGVAQYNAIYGSFAALPLFLVWLQLSWLILLYGAELSFAYQNVDTYEFEPDALQASHRLKTQLYLQIAQYLVASFVKGETPPSARRVSQELDIPIRLVNEILFALEKSNIISATDCDKEGDRGFLPARDIHTLTVQYVIEAMEKRGLNDMPFAHTPEYEAISGTMASFENSLEKLPANKLIKDI
jgi:membrane protein